MYKQIITATVLLIDFYFIIGLDHWQFILKEGSQGDIQNFNVMSSSKDILNVINISILDFKKLLIIN